MFDIAFSKPGTSDWLYPLNDDPLEFFITPDSGVSAALQAILSGKRTCPARYPAPRRSDRKRRASPGKTSLAPARR